MKEKKYRYKVPQYGSHLTLKVVDDVPSYWRECSGREDKKCVAFTAHIKGELTMVVSPKASVGVLAHEAFHAAADVLSYHDVKWGPGNQEPVAYPLGNIMDWIQRRIGRVRPSQS